MKHLLSFTFVLFCFISSFGQFQQRICSGRPGQSFGPLTVGKGVLQVQSGLNFENSFNTSSFKDIRFDNVLRIGLRPKFEINMGIDQSWTNLKGENNNGLNNLRIGYRVNILNEESKNLKLGLQNSFLLPVNYGHWNDTVNIVTILGVSGAYSINEKLGLLSILSVNDVAQLIKSLSINYTLGFNYDFGPLSTFAEFYGDLVDIQNSLSFNTGIYFLLNDNIQLDASIGLNKIPTNEMSGFINVGCSYRFHNR